MEIQTIDWGNIDYAKAWNKQTLFFDELLLSKTNGTKYVNRIILCEHPHTYTLGRNGKQHNMLIDAMQLKRLDACYVQVDRGGDITYHGPGQLVCYPILNLEDFGLGLKDYIRLLEEVVIQVCNKYGVKAGRIKDATGVWIDGDTNNARKICAIGVRCSRFISMHGLAFNINTDLNYFNYINPCGFTNRGVSSLSNELCHDINMQEIKKILIDELYEQLRYKHL